MTSKISLPKRPLRLRTLIGREPPGPATVKSPADQIATQGTQAKQPAPPAPHNPQLAALNLPTVRKQNSPPSVDAPLRERVLNEAGLGPKERLDKFRTMTLAVDAGETFTASSYIYSGSFGAVSVALDTAGEPWAVKVLRTEAKAKAKTSRSPVADVAKELAFTQKYVSAKAYAAVDAHNEVYLFMPLQAGSAREVIKAVADDPQTSQLVTRSIGAQVAQHLASMHAQGELLLDLKPGNIMVDHAGKATMSDFGSAETFASMREHLADLSWNAPGTALFAAPELHDTLLFGVEKAPLPNLAGLDMWSMGMTLLDMVSPLQHGLFYDVGTMEVPGVNKELLKWRAKHLDADGRFDLSKLDSEDAQERQGFAIYFKEVARLDPELCRLVLSDLLVPQEQRADAATLHAKLRDLQPEDSLHEDWARDAMADFGENDPVQASALHALRSRQLDAAAGPQPETFDASSGPTPPETPSMTAAPRAAGSATSSEPSEHVKQSLTLRMLKFAVGSLATKE